MAYQRMKVQAIIPVHNNIVQNDETLPPRVKALDTDFRLTVME